MNLYRIVSHTRAEGPGERFAIWTQGCSRHCGGCMMPGTWSFAPNIERTAESLLEQIAADSRLEGVTVLGGEPFEQPEELLVLVRGLQEMGRSSIVFTGFLLSELLSRGGFCRQVLQYTDVLIDGPYIEALRSFSVPMIGSANQRFHFLTDRYSMEDIPPNRIEARVDSNGRLVCSGMGDFEKLKEIMRGYIG